MLLIRNCETTSVIAAALVALVSTADAAGHDFFSIAVDSGELVRIDGTSGAVTTVGSLGDVFHPNVQMATLDGGLYAIVRDDTWSGGKLIRISPCTGEILWSVPTELDGDDSQGESLFVLDDQLHMSVDPGEDTTSEILVRIEPDGTLVQIADFSGALDDDLDGLETDPDSDTIYNLDHDGSGPTDLFVVTIDPEPQQTWLGALDGSPTTADPVIIDGQMLAIAQSPPRLLTIDFLNGLRYAELPLAPSVTLRGLAWVAATCTADLNCDGSVDGADLGILLASWAEDAPADLDANGTVDGADLGILLGSWGACAQ